MPEQFWQEVSTAARRFEAGRVALGLNYETLKQRILPTVWIGVQVLPRAGGHPKSSSSSS
jgi:hypothetical protein